MIQHVTDEPTIDERDMTSTELDSGPGADDAEPGSETAEPRPDASPQPRSGGMTVTDYDRAMTERSQHARARGLGAPYIPGGEDPDPDATARAERPYIRLLVLMVAGIIIGAFALSIIGLIVLGNAAPA